MVSPIIPETNEEEVLPNDKKPRVVNVKDLAYAQIDSHLAPPSAIPTPTANSGLSPSTNTNPDHEELQSPSNHKLIHPSPLHHDARDDASDQAVYSLNDQFTSTSLAPTQGSGDSPHFPAHDHVADSSFPFPHFRPLQSGTASPAPGQGQLGYGMNIPPPQSGATTPAVCMSRRVSGASIADHPPAAHDAGPPPAPSAGRASRSSSAVHKPAMLGAIGEKKSFFQKMFHHDDKKEKKDKEKELKEQKEAKEAAHTNGRVSRNPSPMASRASSPSPPGTPGTPPPHLTDSDASHPGSAVPSRAPSLKRRVSDKREPHAQPPADSVGVQRRGSQKSTNEKVGALANGQPVAVVKKEEVVGSSGTKFTLKDLIGIGDANKLHRRASDKGSTKGSDRGSTKGGSEYGDGNSTASLLKKYGICDKAAIGKGATAVVRLAHKWDRREEKLYAVKEFRKRRKNETEKDYVKKLTSEFCISSTLHHTNVVETVDLVQDEQHHWCEVMEYCPGGDLYAAIKKGGMSAGEVECTFKQVLLGIQYLHSMGVAHRDIKPENLLLDGRGHVKITDFGVSDVFRMCWEKKTHLSKGLCGSEPYIAPELFEQKEYDARFVDVWAAAIVFYCMQFQELPWRVAKQSDPTFSAYFQAYNPKHALAEGERHPTPPPLNNLIPRECRHVVKHMLDPDPKTRWSIDEALKDKWMMSVEVCREGEVNGHSHTSAGMDIVKI